MKIDTTPDQVATYRRDGYLIVEEFLSMEELAEIKAAVVEAMDRIGRQRVAGNWEVPEPEGYQDTVVVQRVNLWKVNTTIRRYLLDPGLGRMLARLAGVKGIRVWHDQTFFKPPWGDPTAFHLDMPNWSFASPNAISIWIALDAATIQSGCIYYLPGSHAISECARNASIREHIGSLFNVYPELRDVEARPAEAGPGTAVLHNGLTVHAAGPNMTPRWRRAMTCQYMPDGATFNGNRCILTEAQISALKIGDRLDDELHNPRIWNED